MGWHPDVVTVRQLDQQPKPWMKKSHLGCPPRAIRDHASHLCSASTDWIVCRSQFQTSTSSRSIAGIFKARKLTYWLYRYLTSASTVSLKNGCKYFCFSISCRVLCTLTILREKFFSSKNSTKTRDYQSETPTFGPVAGLENLFGHQLEGFLHQLIVQGLLVAGGET